jgi:hypothetical protein
LNIVAVGDNEGLRGWARTNLSIASNIWAYTVGGNMFGLASKSTTTWFLASCRNIPEFIKFHFEVANTAQLTYTASGADN